MANNLVTPVCPVNVNNVFASVSPTTDKNHRQVRDNVVFKPCDQTYLFGREFVAEPDPVGDGPLAQELQALCVATNLLGFRQARVRLRGSSY